LNPPRWLSIVNVRTEHGHRLAAACVALLTIVTAVVVRRTETRPAVLRTAAIAVGLILFQALLGGLRVLHLSIDLAMVHAMTAQVFLCVVVALATLTSPRWDENEFERTSRADTRRTIVLFAAVFVQLILGIIVRHLGADARPLLANGIFHAHVALAVGIAALAVRARRITRSNENQDAFVRATTVVRLIALQIALGVLTFAVTETMSYERQATMTESWLPTIHVFIGAGVLAACVRSLVCSFDFRGPRASTMGHSAPLGEPSR
jgi:cytochrome c oxidase assembly protein subunit 15